MLNPIALYIHIPFCVSKCAYCDFTSYAGNADRLPRYLTRLEAEIAAAEARSVTTVFIGGGTPSLLSGAELSALMDAVRSRFNLLHGAEITIEANPGTLDSSKLDAYLGAGVNRLSIGAQAAQPPLLNVLGRIHDWPQAVRAVELARAAGFNNINIDLMYALPGQTMADWRLTLDAASVLNVEHISAYSLIVEDGTPIAARIAAGELSVPDDDTTIEMQRTATRALAGAGLERYEISNYAKPGYECRHNIAYWTLGEYLGLGAAAHSLMGGARFSNSPSLDYARDSYAPLSPDDIREERIMLGTRMTRGIEIADILPSKLDRLHGLVECSNGRLWLTERGMELQNSVVLALIE